MNERTKMQPASVLYPPADATQDYVPPREEPAYFIDLAIDRVLDAVTRGFEPYDLRPIFSFVPHERSVVDYRHKVLRDISRSEVRAVIRRFAVEMVQVRAAVELARKSHYRHQQTARFLFAIHGYCAMLVRLAESLDACDLQSEGLRAIRKALHGYVASTWFASLRNGATKHHEALDSIRYTVLIREGSVTVRDFEEEPDYNVIIADLFTRFRQGNHRQYELEIPRSTMMNHVEGEILNGVTQLNPQVFAELDDFVSRHQDFIDPTISRFDREIQFYVAWLGFTEQLKERGLSFCEPELVDHHEVAAEAGFDLALAEKLRGENRDIVTNDFRLDGPERIFVVTGPNQGGKTTFARMFGQMHYFANLGLTVPGTCARLKLFDRIFTHYEREETLTTLRGKLHDDLVRIRAILDAATPDSLIILNEIFNSTALKDARFLADAVLRRIIHIGALGVCVTFMDELSALGPETVSVTSTIRPDDSAERTFRVVRRPSDGLAYALSIANKYGVTYDRLKERLS